jgi:hypothetical protein
MSFVIFLPLWFRHRSCAVRRTLSPSVQTYFSCAERHIGFLSAHQTTFFRDKRDINYRSFADLGLLSKKRKKSEEEENRFRIGEQCEGKLLNLSGNLRIDNAAAVRPDRSFLGDFRTEIIAYMIAAQDSSIVSSIFDRIHLILRLIRIT